MYIRMANYTQMFCVVLVVPPRYGHEGSAFLTKKKSKPLLTGNKMRLKAVD